MRIVEICPDCGTAEEGHDRIKCSKSVKYVCEECHILFINCIHGNKQFKEMLKKYMAVNELKSRNSLEIIDHPPHYNLHPSGIECIDVTEHMNFNLGNAFKYIWRAGLKNGNAVQDLEKAIWYLQREIKRITKHESV